MKHFSLILSKKFVDIPSDFLGALHEVCNLISMYEGPSLVKPDSINETDSVYSVRGMKHEYAFTYTREKSLSFGYFLKGEALLKITVDEDGKAEVFLPDDGSQLAEMELRKILLKHTGEPNALNEARREKPFCYSFDIRNDSLYSDVFLRGMNEICQELTGHLAPLFDFSGVVYEVRQETHESFMRLERKKGIYRVWFLNHSWDSGSHSYPNGNEYEFFLEESGKRMIDVRISGRNLRFESLYADAERLKMLVQRELEPYL